MQFKATTGKDGAHRIPADPAFGQLLSGSADQDILTMNHPDGRLIDVMLRVSF